MAKKKGALVVPQEESVAVKQSSVDVLLSDAVKAGASVETLERLFSLRERVMAEQAKQAYVDAVAGFQSDVPVIKKTKAVLNKDGRTVRYMFAPLDAIVDQIKEPLKRHGLSYRWDTKTADKVITAICTITHTMGHSESSSFEVPVDPEGYMTAPQKTASALTFAKRYALINALGISTGDEDTDATDVGKEKTPLSPKAKIVFLLRALHEDAQNAHEVVQRIAKLELIEANYPEIINRLEAQVRENNENN